VSRKPFEERSGVVFTAHRATNVDDPRRLEALISIVVGLAAQVGPVTFPVHPRTESRLREAGSYERLDAEPLVSLLPPLPYRPMLEALSGALVVVTDSGGLQEEASWLGVPAVVLRSSTPRWEGVAAGSSKLVGIDVDGAIRAAVDFAGVAKQREVAGLPCPYGDGHTAHRVASLLADPDVAELITLREPDYTDGSLPPEAAQETADRTDEQNWE
jgi:UDP-N-acetylglucosamine 2-epimerase (non-hydrolysing)